MQASLAASQTALADAWPAAYGSAPIWRFWLSADICAQATLGAFMTSLDGIGRSYPLALLASGDLAPPECHAREDWFAAVEDFLWEATGPHQDYDTTLAAFAALAPAPSGWTGDAAEDARAVHGGVVATGGAAATPSTFARLRVMAQTGLFAGGTYWWTQGNDVTAPQALALTGLPDPSLLAGMLTGNWSGASGRGSS
jgi:type VI secretion system protein ImpM